MGFLAHKEGYCLHAKVGSKKEQLCTIEPSTKLYSLGRGRGTQPNHNHHLMALVT